MTHYIDADCLKAEIERRRLSNRYIDTEGYESELLDIITSLQQEQPEGLHFTPLNRLIQKIPSGNWNDTVNNYAKKLRDCLIKEGYRKDAEVLQGYISYMNGNNVPMATMDGQEQPQVADASKMVFPKVDLQKEVQDYICSDEYLNTRGDGSLLIARHFYGLRNRALEEAARHVYESWMGGTMDDVRRDMVELGKVLNARKEDR